MSLWYWCCKGCDKRFKYKLAAQIHNAFTKHKLRYLFWITAPNYYDDIE